MNIFQIISFFATCKWDIGIDHWDGKPKFRIGFDYYDGWLWCFHLLDFYVNCFHPENRNFKEN
jgi:hypothetical protein